MGCRISRRQAHPPARTAAESVDIDVRFIAEAVRAAVSRVIRQGVGVTDRVALVPDLPTGSRSPRWAARADRIGVGAAMTQLSAGSPFETVLGWRPKGVPAVGVVQDPAHDQSGVFHDADLRHHFDESVRRNARSAPGEDAAAGLKKRIISDLAAAPVPRRPNP